ncbi:globin [Photobacterium ganghwense]|uniref:Globin n=2 Tax=Vibrionaceae TaxID=641 RepID=A0A0J1K0X3_9GAMM|nr:globin [Photobacterium ganghwense]KLV08122.1 hypothetical protein ABT57_14990 [Photobacterium ganghwense]
MHSHQIFNDSYRRCLKHERFFDVFYNIFWCRDERFRKMFKGVDMARQIKMLKFSISMLMLCATSANAREAIRLYGCRHGSSGPGGIGATAADYDIWLDCLIDTVELCDPKFDESVAAAWRHCFASGIAIMKEECETVSRRADEQTSTSEIHPDL